MRTIYNKTMVLRIKTLAKARIEMSTLEEAVNYVTAIIDRINYLPEYCPVMDTIQLDDLFIPREWEWLIQPESLRLFNDSKFVDLRDREVWDPCDFTPDLTIAKWTESWQIIYAAFQKDFIPGSNSTSIGSLRKRVTLDEGIAARLAHLSEETCSPSLVEETDPVFVSYLPFVPRNTGRYEESDFNLRVSIAVSHSAQRNSH